MSGGANAFNDKITATTARRAALEREIAAARERLITMTQALVQVDSQTPPSATGPVADVAASFLDGLPGVELTRIVSEPPVVNLIARLRGGLPGPRLILNGHLDTYPIGDRGAWGVDPLSGEVAGSRLYGRGAADMKGGIAAQLLVMDVFARHAVPFPGELLLVLAGDEESMGELGTQWLIDHHPEVRGDAVLVADVGSPAVVRCGEKGMVWLEVTSVGTAAHGAHVHRGANAIERLIAALQALQALESLPVTLPAEVAATTDAARPLSEPLGGEGEHDVLRRVTVNIGQIEGGLSANLVPASALARLDIRIPPGITVAAVEREIDRRLATLPGIEWRVTRRYEATWTAPDDPIVVACLQAAAQVLGGPVMANLRVGASDARLWRRAGIATVVCGLTPHNLGGPDEFLDIDELSQIATIHVLTADAFLHRTAP